MLALAVLSLAASAFALEVNTPTAAIHSESNTTITWSSKAGDPNFNIFVYEPAEFNQRYAIANNVNVTLDAITLELPSIPPNSSYIYQFTNISNDSDVYSQSSVFSIAAACDSGCDSTSSVAPSGASGTGASASTSTSSGSGSSSSSASSTSSSAASSPTSDGAASIGVSGALTVVAGLLAYMAL